MIRYFKKATVHWGWLLKRDSHGHVFSVLLLSSFNIFKATVNIWLIITCSIWSTAPKWSGLTSLSFLQNVPIFVSFAILGFISLCKSRIMLHIHFHLFGFLRALHGTLPCKICTWLSHHGLLLAFRKALPPRIDFHTPCNVLSFWRILPN